MKQESNNNTNTFENLKYDRPTNCLCFGSFVSVSTQRTGQHMKRTIHSYCLALIDIRTKSFGKVNVKSRSTITRTLVDNYWNAVYNKAHRKKAKHKGEEQEVTSKRQLNKLWQEKVINK